MESDRNKPLLRVDPRPQNERRIGKSGYRPKPKGYTIEQQSERFGPQFDRLREILARDLHGLSLRSDPGAMAPERLLVFEIQASVDSFAASVSKIRGLELIEEEFAGDEIDKEAVAYLLVPDAVALNQIESLWRRWKSGNALSKGFTPWAEVFKLLRELRPWGPQDRIDAHDANILAQEIEERDDSELVRLEIELVFRVSDCAAQQAEDLIVSKVQSARGKIVSKTRICEIEYHACLVDLPVSEVRAIIDRKGVSMVESVMHIRPQSVAAMLETKDAEPMGEVPEIGFLGEPILALLDGVPVSNHPLLERHLSVEDPFDLQALTAVGDRKHGTAMASLIVHGDRNCGELPLPRKIHVLPVMMAEQGKDEAFPCNRLIVDVIYQAVRSMRAGAEASAPEVLIVNLSLGNARQPFHRKLSSWAKLLDRLSYEYGILFVVSAGNVLDAFDVPAYATRTAFEDADPDSRARAIISAVGGLMAQRKLFSPAETVNGITIGACNMDDVPSFDQATARNSLSAFSGVKIANPSSALGPGYGASVKPDILMPGSRERLFVMGNAGGVVKVKPYGPSRAAGLKVAAPPISTDEKFEFYTSGTSAAAALASRTCHRIHDALQAAYGSAFLCLTHRQRAVLLKALLAHTAQWPKAAAAMIRDVIGPPDSRQHVRQKDNIRRFLGYGVVDAMAATECAGDRATFWATGEILENQVMHIPIPVPLAMANKAQRHALIATTAWFTPTKPGNKRYRAVRLKLLKPNELGMLGLNESFSDQPDSNQVNRGTLFHQRWYGEKAAAVTDDLEINLRLQREPDLAGMVIDEPIPFAVAVTLTMPGVVEIYDQVRQRLGIPLFAI